MPRKAAPKKAAPKKPIKPLPNKAAEKTRKRKVVAAGIVAGKKSKVIGRELGCTDRTVRRIAAEKETQFLITRAIAPYTPELEALLPRVMDALGDALVAEKTDSADHFTRLRAIERHGELMELAQGKPKEETVHEMRLITAQAFFDLTGVDPFAQKD